ncbi:MAG: methyltransferase domain-containing protein [Chloroflexi bacterium]|nr:methyltransferase domain-containing protein [Chloroflexota bacterium]
MTIETTEPILQQPYDPNDDHLWRQLKSIPAFRAVLRAVEARFYQKIELPEPILDLGCGDGHFAEMTFDKPISVGIDPWWGPLQKAKRSGMYNELIYGMGNDMPFPDESFASLFSNSVLEHIPDIQPVLNESSRVLQENGKLVITMPSHYFTEYMGGAAFFERIGANGLAEKYRQFFNTISRHAHTDAPEVWADRLAQAGFEIEQWQYYFSKEALRALEIGHAQGLPSAIIHALTGHWIVAPWNSSLQRTEQWLRPFYNELFDPNEGAYILIIARKRANHPIDAPLPPARPFTLVELEPDEVEQIAEIHEPLAKIIELEPENNQQSTLRQALGKQINNQQSTDRPADSALSTQHSALSTQHADTPKKSNLLSYTLILVSLFAAIIGQSRIGSNPVEPSSGIGWFIFSAIPLLILGWQHGVFQLPRLPSLQLPTISKIPSQRWLGVIGFLFAFMGYRFTSTPGAERPFFAIISWLIGIAITAYAFIIMPHSDNEQLPNLEDAALPTSESTTIQQSTTPHTIPIAIGLFIIALIIRSINLSTHPFILNGIEASIGLDALNIANGLFRNPFATGWLTNPTLSTYLMALSIKILGPSTLSIRLWSPLVGALTVTAVFLIGQKLFDRTIGLVAAVLLAGSHFHLHYSRMGMSNIWDPLITLLALGTIALAWEAGRQEKQSGQIRGLWLLAGLFTGLNAYFFTSSHLLPLMLIALLAWALLFDRSTIWQNGSHLITAAVFAFIVALPQLLFYNNNPTIFMQRAVDVGIFAQQTDWLTQEAARSGLTSTQIIINQIWRGLLGFSGSIDKSSAYRPLKPLLAFGPALFFMLGVITAVFKSRSIKYAMLVIWFVVTAIFAGSFLLDTPNSHRLLIATPALMLLAAIALVTYGRFILAILPKPPNQQSNSPLLPILLVLAILIVTGDLFFYFNTFPTTHNFGDRNTEIADNVSHYLNDLGTEWTAYFYGPPSMYTDFPTIPFLVDDFQRGVNLFDMEEAAAPPTPTSANQVYIFLPERAGELDIVQTAYPDGETQLIAGYYGDPLYYVYEVRSP